MQNVLDTSKRVFSAAIAAATIAFSIGAGALVGPLSVEAASAGDLIKGTSLTTVYYQAYDGKRYAFPNEKTFFTWYADFDDVVTISDSALAAITLGGNIVVRPGTQFVKVTSDAKTYAVGRGGMLHWIESEQVAIDLAGSNWASNIIDIPDVFFDDYTVGTSLMDATAFDGAVYEMGGATYISWDGEMREITSSGMTANNIWDKFVLDGSNIDDSALAMGTDISGEVLALVDAAQTEEGEEPAASGDVTVSAASSMPAGSSVTQGANAVKVFTFNVKAGSEAATLDSVALKMIGAGSPSDLSDVYLYEGSDRLTDARSVNSATRMVTFSNLGLDVEAGETRTLTVAVTVSTTANAADTFGFQIMDDADVMAGGDVGGSFPVSGHTFTITGADSGTVTVTKSGTVSDPTLGENDAEIGMFKIAADNEDASLEMITLKIDNASDHSDFKLWDGSELLAMGEDIGGDLVAFDLSDDAFMITEGNNNIFTVTADVGGEADDAIEVYIDNAIDVVAIGGDYGFGMTATITGYDAGAGCASSSTVDCSYSQVQGGELTLAFNGPSAGDIQVDSQDQELLAFSMTAAQMLTVKELDIRLTTSGGDGLFNGASTSDDDANLTDIRIVNSDTGATLLGPEEMTYDSDTSEAIVFTEDFVIEAGETLNLVITADVEDTMDSGTIVTAHVDTDLFDIEDENGDALSVTTDIVPSTDVDGYGQTARAASLVFALASTPTSTTAVDGTDGVSVVAFTATAGDASDVRVTDFTLTAYGDDDGTPTYTVGGSTASDINDYVESCSLYDGATLLDGPEAPASNGETIRFSDIDWTIAQGSSDTLLVKCNFANTSTAGSAYFGFDLNDATTEVTAEDEDGESLTPSGADLNGGTTPTVAVTLADSGTLAVTVGSSTPSADFVLSSSTGNHVSTFRFTATNESFNVETLTFSEEQAEDDIAVTNSTAYANNISMVTITYPKQDGTTGTKSVGMSGNEAKFSSLDMYVAVGSPADVMVKVDVPLTDRDSGGSATSGEKVRMGLFVDTTNDDNYKAVGVGSGETLDDDNQGAIGDDVVSTDGVHTFVVKETKPTVSLSSLSPIGAAVVGRSEALRFNIAASSNEDVVLNSLTFAIQSSDNDPIAGGSWNACDTDQDGTEMNPSDFDLYNLTDDGTTTTLDLSSTSSQNSSVTQMAAGTTSPWTILKSTGAICDATEATASFVHLTLPTSEVIPKGTTKTFALYFDSTGADAGADDVIRFDIAVDPITSTYLTVSNASNDSSLAPTSTTLNVDSGTAFAVGDVIVYDAADDGVGAADERMLITGISTNALTVVRGYLGTALTATGAVANTDDIYRLPGSMLWKDDGVSGTTGGADDFWGSYLVDNLKLSGNTLQF